MDHWYIMSKQNSLLGGGGGEGVGFPWKSFGRTRILRGSTCIPWASPVAFRHPQSVFQHLVQILFAGNLS